MVKLFICFLLLLSNSLVTAQPVGKYTTHNLHSKYTGRNYELFVSVPASYNVKNLTRYPVLYVLDGNFMFQVMQSNYRALHAADQVSDVIIVGIGYKGTKSILQSMENRTPDYTPTADTSFDNMLTKELKFRITSGNANKFLTALKSEIFPFVEKQYKTSERGVAGHSFGALFGTYVLFKEPTVFKKYLLSSISFPWDKEMILAQEQSFYKSGNWNINADIFLAMGAEEDSAMMIEPMKRFVNSIRSHNYKGLNLVDRVLQYENHPAVYITAFNQGLRMLYKK